MKKLILFGIILFSLVTSITSQSLLGVDTAKTKTFLLNKLNQTIPTGLTDKNFEIKDTKNIGNHTIIIFEQDKIQKRMIMSNKRMQKELT